MLKRHFGEFPYQAPSGYKWVPNGWKLVEVDLTEKLWIKSFEVFLDKIKEPLGKNTGEVKQHRLNCHSKLVSQKEFLEQLQIKEEESKTSKNKSYKKPNKKGLLGTAEKENSSESEIEGESVESPEEEDEESDESIEERKKTWNTLHWHQAARIIFAFCVGFIVSTCFRGELNWKMVRYNLWRKSSTFVYS